MKNKSNQKPAIVFGLSVIALCLFGIIARLYSIILSFKEYQLMMGLANSPWVGNRNFTRFFEMFQFRTIIRNTIVNNGLAVVVAVLLSIVIIYCLSNIKQKSLRMLFSLVLAIPALIPPILSAQGAVFSLGSEAIINHYSLIYACLEGFKLTGWVVLASWLISLDTADKKEGPKILFMLGIFLLVALSRVLTSNLELVNVLYNPLVYEKADVIDSFNYRTGLMNMDVGGSSAAWVFKFLIQLVTGAVAFFGIYKMLTKMPLSTKDESRYTNEMPSIIVCGLLSAVVIGLLIKIIIPSQSVEIPLSQILTPFSVGWLIISLVTAFLSVVIACVMAYPFTSDNKPIHIIYLAFLLPCSVGISTIAQCLLYRTLGLFNTIPSLVISHLMPIWMVLMIGMIILRNNDNDMNRSKSYIQTILPSALTLGGLQFSMIWGGIIQPTIMISNPALFTPAMMIRQLSMNGSINWGLNLMVMLPIIIVWALIGAILIVKKGELK